jgi:hypothetical protein
MGALTVCFLRGALESVLPHICRISECDLGDGR